MRANDKHELKVPYTVTLMCVMQIDSTFKKYL